MPRPRGAQALPGPGTARRLGPARARDGPGAAAGAVPWSAAAGGQAAGGGEAVAVKVLPPPGRSRLSGSVSNPQSLNFGIVNSPENVDPPTRSMGPLIVSVTGSRVWHLRPTRLIQSTPNGFRWVILMSKLEVSSTVSVDRSTLPVTGPVGATW